MATLDRSYRSRAASPFPSPPLAAGRRNHVLDFLHIVFATGVILAHAYEFVDGDQSRQWFNRLTHTGMTLGEVGVDGFFLLSGFLIVGSWVKAHSWAKFLCKRILRIVPGYLVAAVVSTVVVGLAAPGVPDLFHHFLWKRFLLSICTLDFPRRGGGLPGTHFNRINGSLWTIAYEFRCYLLVALLGLCGLLSKKRSRCSR